MKRDLRLAAWLICIVCSCVVLLMAWQAWTARQNTLDNIQTNSANLASALSTYTDGIVKQSELMLIGLTERIEKDGTGSSEIERLRSVIAREMGALPQVSSVSLYNAEGICIFSTNQNATGIDSNQREYFKHHVENASRASYVGPTIISRATGMWVISVSRRINSPDASFAGVMVITIGIEHLLRFYSGIQVGDTGVISLTSSTGQMRLRFPYREGDIGRDLSSTPIFSTYAHLPSGTAEFVSKLDGTPRFYAFARSDVYPLVTVVALGQREAMSAWTSQAKQSMLVVLVLLGLVVALGIRLIGHIHSRIRAEDELLLSQAALIELNQHLELIASEDKLTGLANRRRFDQFIEVEFKRARRERSPLSLVFIDVDYFKRYNDRYGHLAGDECLVMLSRLVEQCIRRPGDIAARYGGEEIAVVLPSTDESSARRVAETILRAIQDHQIEHQASPFAIVTVSLGVATFTGTDRQVDQRALIEQADRALYAAKSQGRNRVSGASEIREPAPVPGQAHIAP
ncbi:GGDEF domain-containing protein [Pseudomonas sp. CDFA 602]|uniref:sensor domain-containing diguanylate cyclase n=1 Tax=Pseudomonas californiensis TaxID=2829823 RepID=UPI001E364918|nr:sensor domain-containing diguanylate cyclase [Pseudomonas californiensis]MCD5993424.1 GGDEF domain-containing protein [Pseudomonas californiensis]MCD5999019.1 GGDEF domain-containing protein [Pseudomonas californiensis]